MKKNERARKTKMAGIEQNIENHTNVIRQRKEKDLVQIEQQLEEIEDKLSFIRIKLDGGLRMVAPVFEYEKTEIFQNYQVEQHKKAVRQLNNIKENLIESKQKVLDDIKEREKYIEDFKKDLKSIKPDYIA